MLLNVCGKALATPCKQGVGKRRERGGGSKREYVKKLRYRTVVMAVIASDLYNRSYYDGRYGSSPSYSADGQHNTNHGVSLCTLVVVCFLLGYSLSTKTLYKSTCRW